MDFRRRLSSGGESFTEGTSRFFSSMIAKKNGLMNDLSNKIESVGATLMKTSSSGSSFSDADVDDVQSDVTSLDRNDIKTSENKENNVDRVSRQSSERSSPVINKNEIKMSAHVHRRQDSGSSGSGSLSGNEGNFSTSAANMSFDEPLYSPSRVTSSEKTSSGIGPSWKGRNTPPSIPPPPYNPNKTGRRSSRSSTNSPKLSSGHSSDSEKYVNDKVAGEERSKAPTFASTKRRSSTVDEMLFDDYVEPEPEVVKTETNVETQQDNTSVVNKRKTLLPMGDLISFDEPELEDFHPKGRKDHKDNSNSKEKARESSREKSFPSVSSVDSSDFPESGLNNQTSVDSSEPEYERDHSRRLGSMGSERSWSSNYSLDSQPDDLTVECMNFMKGFVDKIFNPREDTGQMEKAKFGELCQQVPGRQWFARYVNSQRVVSKKVEESIFFRLVQYFAVALFECNEAEDFVPAKNLMNMCFTFYHEIFGVDHLKILLFGKGLRTDPPFISYARHGKQRYKNFLYSYLREQPIWQSLRFWNAAFFDAVQNERARKPVCTSEDGHDSQNDDSMFQENITFGQLGTFTCNMRAFGLSRELCVEFLRKQSTIADLKDDQIKMLKDNIDKWRDH